MQIQKHHSVRWQAQIDCLELEHTPNQHACGSEHRDGECDLSHNQQPAPTRGSAAGDCRRSASQRGHEVSTQEQEGGGDACEQCRHQYRCKREQGNRPIDANRLHPRESVWHERYERLKARPRDREPDDARDHGKNEAFGEYLLEDSPASCPQSGTQRELASPCLPAQQQQVGDVGTCDQQHEANGAEQCQHRRANIADDDVRRRDQRRARARARTWRAPRRRAADRTT